MWPDRKNGMAETRNGPQKSDPSQLGNITDRSSRNHHCTNCDPIPTPDGRWLRVYALADGSVQQKSTEDPLWSFRRELAPGTTKAATIVECKVKPPIPSPE